ncbi:MAG: hypothetical protein OEX19_04760, partial [Gammaproteobacteria bacterium]|nr:hypothetical protein [Gammaproteobacteria bacterium]
MTLLCVAVLGSARADIGNMFEQTLMPGPLSHPHEKLQKDCNSCHRLFDKKAQSKLCVGCHDHRNIKTDIDQSRGFHGKSTTV